MINSLVAIQEVKKGNLNILKKEIWLRHLYLTNENNVNLENITSFNKIENNHTLNYVEKSLELLNSLTIKPDNKKIIEETLKWSEVAKCGLPHIRENWLNKRIDLSIHNIGSSQIYEKFNDIKTEENYIVSILIASHGLIGQYIRGEINLKKNKIINHLVTQNFLEKKDLREILINLNMCIIKAVSFDLWHLIKEDVIITIDMILSNSYSKQLSAKERMKKIRNTSILNGEDFNQEYDKLISSNNIIRSITNTMIENNSFWYIETALSVFTFEEFIKIVLIADKQIKLDMGYFVNNGLRQDNIKNNNINLNCKRKTFLNRHLENMKINDLSLDELLELSDFETDINISFEKLMKGSFYNKNGKKEINIYKQRIIENYLSTISFEDILSNTIKENNHVKFSLKKKDILSHSYLFNFEFSAVGMSLIDFCLEAEKNETIHKKAIILLFDLFNLRKDKYDRLGNEKDYLTTMNSSVGHKSIILDYIVGDKIVDIGPGGGALMDMIVDRFPERNVLGIDISKNVIEELNKKKYLDNKKWNVIQGDVMELQKYVEVENANTIIFSSIIHELYSYISFAGKQFNINTVSSVLLNAFNALSVGGRIVIRDGIMSDNKNDKRIIEFTDENGFNFLKRYVQDFKGRKIEYELLSKSPYKVSMLINDAMEFLYTYTWGEDSYSHEVQEQFGYLTKKEYEELVFKLFKDSIKIIKSNSFLQDGYEENLSDKVKFLDVDGNKVSLPDSTYILVLEKTSF